MDNVTKYLVLTMAIAAAVGFGYANLAEAAYTPSSANVAAWDAATNIPKNVSGNGTWITSDDILMYNGRSLFGNGLATQDNSVKWSVDFPNMQARTLYVRYTGNDDRAIVTVSIDGVNQSGTIDMYTSAISYNKVSSITIVPQRQGKNAMQLWGATKNIASAGYRIMIQDWWII